MKPHFHEAEGPIPACLSVWDKALLSCCIDPPFAVFMEKYVGAKINNGTNVYQQLNKQLNVSSLCVFFVFESWLLKLMSISYMEAVCSNGTYATQCKHYQFFQPTCTTPSSQPRITSCLPILNRKGLSLSRDESNLRPSVREPVG